MAKKRVAAYGLLCYPCLSRTVQYDEPVEIEEKGCPMKIEEQTVDAVVIVSLDGRVDGSTAPDLEKHISDVVERGNTRILLDCSKMSYIGSTGLRVMLAGAKKCQQGGGKLTLCTLRATCKSVMEVSGFLTMLDYYDTRESALAAQS